MIKQLLLLAAATASFGQLASAASCGSTSLAAYVALGSTGCTIGADTLSNFTILTGFGTPVAAASVNIGPTGGSSGPTLTFSTTQTASNGNALEAIFTYDISGPLFSGLSTVLSNSSETADGGVTDLINVCEGGPFGPDGVTGCGSTTDSLLTLDGVQNTDMSPIGMVGFLAVTNDLIIDPGTAGTASAGTFTNSFTASLTAVPEPVSTALAAVGLALAGILKIRKNVKE